MELGISSHPEDRERNYPEKTGQKFVPECVCSEIVSLGPNHGLVSSFNRSTLRLGVCTFNYLSFPDL